MAAAGFSLRYFKTRRLKSAATKTKLEIIINKITELQSTEINLISGGISGKVIGALSILSVIGVVSGHDIAGLAFMGEGVILANEAVIAAYKGKSYMTSLWLLGTGLFMVVIGASIKYES